MTWLKMDDQYWSNPKIVEGGHECLALDVAAMCYAANKITDGFVPESTLGMLVPSLKNPKKIAKKLIEVGRWSRDDDKVGYWIHDFLEYNPSRSDVEERRRKEAEKKAKQRDKSGRNSSGQFESLDSQSLPMSPGDNNGTPQEVHEGVPPYPVPGPVPPEVTTVNNSSSTDSPGPVDDEDRNSENPVLSWCWNLMAEQDLKRREAAKGPVKQRDAWLKTAANKQRFDHINRAEELLRARPDLTAVQLQNLLQHPANRPIEAAEHAHPAPFEGPENEQPYELGAEIGREKIAKIRQLHEVNP